MSGSQGSKGASNPGVDLAPGGSAGALLHGVLRDAVQAFPEALTPAELPEDGSAFRSDYADVLALFEAARVASGERVAIARRLHASARESLVGSSDERAIPLAEFVRTPSEPLALTTVDTSGSGGWDPAVPVDGAEQRGQALRDQLARWREKRTVSPSAPEALGWLLDVAEREGGELDLRGRRVAILGAGAELAPTLHLLEAGAEVLWLDLADPPAELAKDSRLSGRLHFAAGGLDLLARPAVARATIERFAESGAVDVGLYAYAPGRGREWRLAATMNAIVEALPRDAVRTVSMLVSPTSPAARTASEDADEEARFQERAAWRRALTSSGALGSGGGALRVGDAGANRAIVPIQGLSYQAAQYLEKWITAEVWATDAAPLHVSANVAGITRTRSLQHPIFAAAFVGAGAFGVETYAPETTRPLMGLLSVRDWLDPTSGGHPRRSVASEAERAAALTEVRVHGGLYGMPEALEPALRIAALIGFAKRPTLLAGLLRR